MEYTLSFADSAPFAQYANFELAMIATRFLSAKMIGEQIVLRSTFFTYVYVNGIEQ